MSTFKIAFKYMFGGIDGVVEYVLGVLNDAIANLDPSNKTQIQGVLNIATKVCTTLKSLQWLCPTKWQTAYGKTVVAVQHIVLCLGDLAITKMELDEIVKYFGEAVSEWRSDDDETCV